MAQPPVIGTGRRVDRVETKLNAGPDSQVDDKNIIIMPSDPRRTDPFLLLAEDWFSDPGFEWHPHRGIETVTLVLDGVLEHGDNTGNAGALESGDVQWMTAGRGIIHRELAYRNEHAHTLQLWLNLPERSRMVDTRYQDLRGNERPTVTTTGVSIDMISGAHGTSGGPALNHWPINGAIVTIEPNTTIDYSLPANHRAFAYVLDGQLTIGGTACREGQIAWSDPTSKAIGISAPSSALTLTTKSGDAPSRVMIYSGQPINEPIAMGGPFVMNNKAQITQAFTDYQAGKFGQIPRQARLKHR